jgi:transaldolase
LDAYRDHGRPEARLEEDLDEAQRVFACLEELGICMDDQVQQLEDAGVEKFVQPFDKLMASLARK